MCSSNICQHLSLIVLEARPSQTKRLFQSFFLLPNFLHLARSWFPNFGTPGHQKIKHCRSRITLLTMSLAKRNKRDALKTQHIDYREKIFKVKNVHKHLDVFFHASWDQTVRATFLQNVNLVFPVFLIFITTAESMIFNMLISHSKHSWLELVTVKVIPCDSHQFYTHQTFTWTLLPCME